MLLTCVCVCMCIYKMHCNLEEMLSTSHVNHSNSSRVPKPTQRNKTDHCQYLSFIGKLWLERHLHLLWEYGNRGWWSMTANCWDSNILSLANVKSRRIMFLRRVFMKSSTTRSAFLLSLVLQSQWSSGHKVLSPFKNTWLVEIRFLTNNNCSTLVRILRGLHVIGSTNEGANHLGDGEFSCFLRSLNGPAFAH